MAHFHAKKLASQGCRVHVLSTKFDNTIKPYSIIQEEFEGIQVLRIIMPHEDMIQSCSNFLNPKVDVLFQQVLNVLKPHIVHAHNIACLSANILLLAKEYGAKTAVTLHDHWGYCFRNTMMKLDGTLCNAGNTCSGCETEFQYNNKIYPLAFRKHYLRYVFNQVDLLLPPSSYLGQCYKKSGISGQRMQVLWYGVDNNRYFSINRIPSKQVRFTFNGYLGEHKGILVLIKAFSHLDKNSAYLNVAGTGHLEKETANLVKKLSLSANIRFWGKVPNEKIEEVYKQTDVLIMPSIWPENQPLSIAEGLASGCPVITTKLGGSVELVKDGCTGFCVEPGNPLSLAEAINRFIEHPELLQKMGAEARESMIENCMDKRMRQLQSLYAELENMKTDIRDNGIPILTIPDFDTELLSQTLKFYQGNDINVFPMEWLPGTYKPKNPVFWLHYNNVSTDDIVLLSRKYKAKLLVPAGCHDLVNHCRKNKCGLYYSDPAEAAVCLEYIKSNSNHFHSFD